MSCTHSQKSFRTYGDMGCVTCYVLRRRQLQPMFRCPSCDRWKRLFMKGVCCGCYNHPNAKRRINPVSARFCPICLTLFKPVNSVVNCCSLWCRSVLRHSLMRNGKIYRCDRCRKLRVIRCKRMCSSCYVYSRHLLHKYGVGGCAVRRRDILNVGV